MAENSSRCETFYMQCKNCLESALFEIGFSKGFDPLRIDVSSLSETAYRLSNQWCQYEAMLCRYRSGVTISFSLVLVDSAGSRDNGIELISWQIPGAFENTREYVYPHWWTPGYAVLNKLKSHIKMSCQLIRVTFDINLCISILDGACDIDDILRISELSPTSSLHMCSNIPHHRKQLLRHHLSTFTGASM